MHFSVSALCLAVVALAAAADAKIYFQENFDKGWEKRWVTPTSWKSAGEMGKWKHTAGEWYGKKTDKGIQTTKDAKFHGMSALMDQPFNNEGKDLIIQYSVKHEQNIDCGGAYIKLLPAGFDQDEFGGDTPYAIMFGPDICGHSTRKTHVIFNYEGENLLTKNEPRCEVDQLTHVYTLIVRPDNTYEVQIDGEQEKAGRLEDDWAFLKPKEIRDPDQSKPSDWVDEKMIPDPEDKKPEGYDDIPEMIPDPDAEKPEDWDDEDDGEWEPPMVENEEYMGPFVPKMIKNPDYKGEWEHPMIPNPEYVADDALYHRCNPSCGAVGFELWQVKSGTIFDDIIVTDSLEEAQAFAAETHGKKAEKEKDMYEEIQEEKRAEAEQKRAEAEEARRKAEEEADDEDEEEVDPDAPEDEDEDDENAELRSEL